MFSLGTAPWAAQGPISLAESGSSGGAFSSPPSILAAVGAILMARTVTDGPFEVASSPFSISHIGAALRNRGVRLSTYGYLGHMWELCDVDLDGRVSSRPAPVRRRGGTAGWVPIATFAIIAVGGPASFLAGRLADIHGRELVAGTAMAISGISALATLFVFGRSPLVVLPVFLVWGATVVADSAQFSALVTEAAAEEGRGTALTLQTGLGFLLTLVTIRGVPLVAGASAGSGRFRGWLADRRSESWRWSSCGRARLSGS